MPSAYQYMQEWRILTSSGCFCSCTETSIKCCLVLIPRPSRTEKSPCPCVRSFSLRSSFESRVLPSWIYPVALPALRSGTASPQPGTSRELRGIGTKNGRSNGRAFCLWFPQAKGGWKLGVNIQREQVERKWIRRATP